MAITLTDSVFLCDDLALTVAKVLFTANQRAEAAGINAVDSLISVNQYPRAEAGCGRWSMALRTPWAAAGGANGGGSRRR